MDRAFSSIFMAGTVSHGAGRVKFLPYLPVSTYHRNRLLCFTYLLSSRRGSLQMRYSHSRLFFCIHTGARFTVPA